LLSVYMDRAIDRDFQELTRVTLSEGSFSLKEMSLTGNSLKG